MKGLYRVFLIAMILVIVLGAVLLVAGAQQHSGRPRTPSSSGSTIRYDSVQSVQQETKHV